MELEDSASLPASLIVPALVRQVQAEGGFATILNKGSQYGSSLLIILRDKGQVTALECLPSLTGKRNWVEAVSGETDVSSFIERQIKFDSDLWVIELDIAEPARFIPR